MVNSHLGSAWVPRAIWPCNCRGPHRGPMWTTPFFHRKNPWVSGFHMEQTLFFYKKNPGYRVIFHGFMVGFSWIPQKELDGLITGTTQGISQKLSDFHR